MPSLVSPRENWYRSGPALVMYIAAFKFLIELAVAGRYGYHADELYYLACAEHLDWGYIDHPPLVDLIAFLVRHSLGESLFAIRFVPALAGALQVYLVGTITRRVGGGRFAQSFAAIAVLVTPSYLDQHHYLQLMAFEPAIWAGLAYLVLRAIQTKDKKYWLFAGFLVGIGLETKYSIALFIVGLLVGLLWGHARETFLAADFWAASFLALIVFFPNLLWQMRHNFPFLKWQLAISEGNMLMQPSYFGFVRDQFVNTLPMAFLWIAGLWFFLASRRGKPYRFLGVGVLFVIVAVALVHGKSYYPTPAYGIAFTGGAILIEEITKKSNWRWVRIAIAVAIISIGAAIAPCVIPILPIERVAAYQNALRLALPIGPIRLPEAGFVQTAIPPKFAWEFGWEEIVSAVAQVYESLPDYEKPRVGIFTDSYASAGAIDLLGRKHGLPKAVCPMLAYYDWGNHNFNGDTLIMVEEKPDLLRKTCSFVQPGPLIKNPYGYDLQRGPIVNLCTGGLATSIVREHWDRLRPY